MDRHLVNKVGEVGYEKLIAGVLPPLLIGGGTIAGVEAETVYPRGTVLALDTDTGLLCILGTEAKKDQTLAANCILTDEVTAGAANVDVTVYIQGCFIPDALIVADGYTLTAADRDSLRTHGIVLASLTD